MIKTQKFTFRERLDRLSNLLEKRGVETFQITFQIDGAVGSDKHGV